MFISTVSYTGKETYLNISIHNNYMTSERPGTPRHIHRFRDRTILAGQKSLLKGGLRRAGERTWRLAHGKPIAGSLEDALERKSREHSRLEREAKKLFAEYTRVSRETGEYLDAICSEATIEEIRADAKKDGKNVEPATTVGMVRKLKEMKTEFCFELEERACDGLMRKVAVECPEVITLEWVKANPQKALAALDAMEDTSRFVRHVYEQEEQYYQICYLLDGGKGSYAFLLEQIFSAYTDICETQRIGGGKVTIEFRFAKGPPEEWGVDELVSAFAKKALGTRMLDAEGKLFGIKPPEPSDMTGRVDEIGAAIEVANRVLEPLKRAANECREWRRRQTTVVPVDFSRRNSS
jgi:hypothetical protein